MQISGIVKEIYEGTTKTGRSAGKPFWSITLDTNQKLTAFNLDFIRDVEEGMEYTFTYETDGKYANLTAPTVPCIPQGYEIREEMGSEKDGYPMGKVVVPVRNDSETTPPDSTTAPQTHEELRKEAVPYSTTVPLGGELPKRDTGTKDFVKGAFKQVEESIPKIYSSGNKDEAIRKAVALKAAVEFSDSVAGSTGNIKKVIEYAREFEKYLEGDEEVPF